MSDQIRAAGGVVIRPGREGPEVAVVHRPKYDDWSLPKGKLKRDEGFEAGALREVEEETGCRCEIVRELPSSRYRDQKDRPKLVRWYEMRVLECERFEPGDEIDRLRWLRLGEALALLDYEHERALVVTLSEGVEGR